MKFATILRQAGFEAKEFPKCAEIPITLYDGKNRIISDEDVHFVEKLFVRNNRSFQRFESFLKKLEKECIESMEIRIDENYVIVFHRTPNYKFFSRTESLYPMDCKD